MKKGILIVFEGLDRCGKTTQSQLLYDQLKSSGHECVLLKFPDRDTAIGKLINDYLSWNCLLDDQAIHLLFSANRHEKKAFINKCINNGVIVITDRYSYSGIAYSSAKGLDLEWCKSSDIGLPEADVVFYLDNAACNLEDRLNFGIERYENKTFQEQVASKFSELFDKKWINIDASLPINIIHKTVLDIIRETIANNYFSENRSK